MKKDLEGVQTIYRKGQLVAIIKRDAESKKHIVYLCSEATSEDIAGLMETEINVGMTHAGYTTSVMPLGGSSGKDDLICTPDNFATGTVTCKKV